MAESTGNILLSFKQSKMKVNYSGDRDSMFGLNDVDILRAMLALEGMFAAQTGLSTEEIDELMKDERESIQVDDDKGQFEMEDVEVIDG